MEGQNSGRAGLFIFTIGHSIHSTERIIDLLKSNRVDVLVDVRSEPYSRKVPHFNKDKLEKDVQKNGLRYLFLGKELGGRPSKREFCDLEGFVLYRKIADSPDFQSGIARLMDGLKNYRIALMCGEENPANCHRRLLIGRVLSGIGVEVLHIRGDGRIQSEEEILMGEHERNGDTNQQTLFVSEEAPEWKSTQSVLRRKAPNNSSAH
jgi:uncharacterized protein (DUF488 family)